MEKLWETLFHGGGDYGLLEYLVAMQYGKIFKQETFFFELEVQVYS